MSDSFDGAGNGTDNSGNTGGPTPPPFGGAPGAPASSPFLPPTQPVYSNPQSTPVYGDRTADTSVTNLVEGSSPPKRSRGKMVGALVGVLALLGAGAFAVTKISNDDSASGGAASPKEVGDKLVKSLDGEDLLGVIDLLLPGERDTFRQPLLDLNKELKRLEVTDGSVDLNKVPGFDITIDDPVVTANDTSADDISTVDVSGTASVAVNGKDLPIGQLLIDKAFGGDRPDVDSNEDAQDFDVQLTTVKQDGHWYLSMFYSVAQQIAGDADIPDKGVTPVGADSPEGAVDNMITAIGDLDLEAIIAGLNPNEASALQRYAPLFLDDAQSSLDDLDADITISDTAFKVTGSGDERQVAVTAFKVDASSGDSEVTAVLKDGCATVSSDGQSASSCTGEDSDDGVDSAIDGLNLDDDAAVKQLVEDAREAFSDFDMHGVVVNKVDGKWFISPLGTGSEAVLSVLRALDRDEIDTLIDDGKPALESIFDGLFSGTTVDTIPDTTDDTTFDTIPSDDTTFDTFPTNDTTDTTTQDTSTDNTITDDTITDDTITDSSTGDTTFDTTDDTTSDTVNLDTTTFYSDCLYGDYDPRPTDDEASACIQKGLTDGRFDRSDVPGPYQFPDCGLFSYFNGDDIYSATPEEFQTAIQPGLQCVLDAAASAGADLTYASPEFVHPECFVGVNPYNYSGDTDAITEAYNCAYDAD